MNGFRAAARLTAAIAVVMLHPGTTLAAERLPAETFFRDPEFINIQLSPDGEKLGVLSRQDGEYYNLLVLELATGRVHQITSLAETSVFWYGWIDGEHLVFHYTQGPSMVDGYYVVSLDGGKAKRLGWDDWFWTPGELGLGDSEYAYYVRLDGNRGEIARCRYGRGMRHPEKQVSRLWRRVSGRTTVRMALLDQDCQLRAALATESFPDENRVQLWYRDSTKSDWRKLEDYPFGEPGLIPLALEQDGRHLLVTSDVGRDTRAVYRYDPATGTLGEMIYGNEVYDVALALVSDTGELLGVGFADESVRFVWLEPGRVRLARALAGQFPGYGHFFQFSADGRTALVETVSDRDPGTYWLYDAGDNTLREILRPRDWIRPEQMAAVKPIEFEARDGLRIRGYLTRPPDAGDGPLPMIVHPHGGPHWVRDFVEFNATVQFFANRGYAVLQVDFRGSGGYGAGFVEAGLRQWGEAIQNDITDGVRWAIEEGIADPGRICIYGGSFGGYAALMGAVLEPGLYRCAVSFAGVSDLRDWGNPDSKWFRRQVGDFWDDADKLRRLSPVHRAGEIGIPVMLIHGRRDRTVPWTQTQAMANALEAHHKRFEVLYYENEGHGFYHEDNRIEAHRAIEGFIRRYIAPDPVVAGE